MMPLALAAAGTLVRLQAIEGGARFRQRLADLGLTPGVTLRLIQVEQGGPLIVALRDDARLALGRGMAFKIFVEAITEDALCSGGRNEQTTHHRFGRQPQRRQVDDL